MSTFSKLVLQAGTLDGRNIQLDNTFTGIHRTSGVDNVIDEIWLWGTNIASTSDAAQVTIEFGGTNAANQISASIAPADGAVLLIPGWCLTTSTTTKLDISASCNVTGAININGFVNRISP